MSEDSFQWPSMTMENKDYSILETPLYPALGVDIEETFDEGLKESFHVSEYEFESSHENGDLSWKRPV